LEILAARGFRGLSIEAVAEKSGVAKTTIYRWWSSKDALYLEALWTGRQRAPVPDTGSIRDDTVAHLRGHIKIFNETSAAAILADALAEGLRNPELGKAFRGGLAIQREPFRKVLRQAVERGELPPDLDYDLTIDLLIGPIINRVLVSGGSVDLALAEQIVDAVFGGLRGQSASTSSQPGRGRRRTAFPPMAT